MGASAPFYFGDIMIHVFKAGGDWTSSGGVSYTIKAVSAESVKKYHC